MGDTKSKLIDATIAVLRDDGITGLSARVIAGRAEVNQALVFYHFGTLAGLVDAATRHSVDTSVEHYREAFAAAHTLSELVTIGRSLHQQEHAAGNVALMAQLLAGAQHDELLAAATGYAMSCWITEIETTLRRILAGNVMAEIADPGALARAVSAGFIGLQLYDGVDHAGADEALAALTSLAAIVDAVDDLGPVARKAVNSAIRAGSRKATRPR